MFIKLWNGKEIVAEVQYNWKGIDLKQFIQDKEGIRVRCQRLVVNGKTIDDNKFVFDYNIVSDSTINLNSTSLGGSCQKCNQNPCKCQVINLFSFFYFQK